MHLAVPAFTAFCVVFAPATLDIVVPGIFLAYGVAILVTLGRSAGGLPLVRLEAGGIPGLIWCAVGSALILSAVSDALIALALALDLRLLQPWIISILSSVALLSIGLLIMSKDLVGGARACRPGACIARAPRQRRG